MEKELCARIASGEEVDLNWDVNCQELMIVAVITCNIPMCRKLIQRYSNIISSYTQRYSLPLVDTLKWAWETRGLRNIDILHCIAPYDREWILERKPDYWPIMTRNAELTSSLEEWLAEEVKENLECRDKLMRDYINGGTNKRFHMSIAQILMPYFTEPPYFFWKNVELTKLYVASYPEQARDIWRQAFIYDKREVTDLFEFHPTQDEMWSRAKTATMNTGLNPYLDGVDIRVQEDRLFLIAGEKQAKQMEDMCRDYAIIDGYKYVWKVCNPADCHGYWKKIAPNLFCDHYHSSDDALRHFNLARSSPQTQDASA